MAAKATNGQIYTGTISKIDITRSTICVENFILVSYYVCRSTIMAALQKAGLVADILFMLLSIYNAM